MPAPGWIRHNDFDGDFNRTDPLTPDELRFVKGRERAVTIAESSDDTLSYEYDEWALCDLDGVYYVFRTAGCSCPSPSETWDLVKCGTREEMFDFLVPSNVDDFLLRALEAVNWRLKEPAPAKRETDW